jgi:phage baseplate assembly protein gpV
MFNFEPASRDFNLNKIKRRRKRWKNWYVPTVGTRLMASLPGISVRNAALLSGNVASVGFLLQLLSHLKNAPSVKKNVIS